MNSSTAHKHFVCKCKQTVEADLKAASEDS